MAAVELYVRLRMKSSIILTLLVLTASILSGCKSGIDSSERLGWYVPFVPKNLQMEKFYETPSPSMDHEYMWKIKIGNNEEYTKFEQQFTKAPSNASGVNDYDAVVVFDSHPNWWKKVDFNQGTLYKHRVEVVGSKGGEWANVFALVDKKAGYIFIQAF